MGVPWRDRGGLWGKMKKGGVFFWRDKSKLKVVPGCFFSGGLIGLGHKGVFFTRCTKAVFYWKEARNVDRPQLP